MKKSLFVAPIVAVSLLASCGGSKSSEYHTITFHSNGGTEIPVLKVEDGKLAVEPKEPTKTDLLFKGWYQEEALENYFSFSTKITKDYDLYANWQNKYDFTVTLESDGKSTLEKNGGWFNLDDYKSEIHLTEGLAGKYELYPHKDCYEVSVNGKAIDTFSIDKVDYSPNDFYIVITIPKEYLGENIIIKSVPYCHYLTFTGETDESKIYYYYPESAPSSPIDIQYCTDLNKLDWQDWVVGDENAITLKGDNKTIYVWNAQNTLSTGRINYVSFSTGSEGSSNVLSSGNTMSLVNFSNLSDYCFYGLFEDCKSLVSAPVLSANVLAEHCYEATFKNSGIRVAPKLPATILENNCYPSMFESCFSLVEAPELSATALRAGCYISMFLNCISLEHAPLIGLKSFGGKNSFALRMFAGCTSLSYIKVCFEEPMPPSSDPTDFRMLAWVGNVAPQGTFVCPQVCADKDTFNDFSDRTIPVGWTIDNDMSH